MKLRNITSWTIRFILCMYEFLQEKKNMKTIYSNTCLQHFKTHDLLGGNGNFPATSVHVHETSVKILSTFLCIWEQLPTCNASMTSKQSKHDILVSCRDGHLLKLKKKDKLESMHISYYLLARFENTHRKTSIFTDQCYYEINFMLLNLHKPINLGPSIKYKSSTLSHKSVYLEKHPLLVWPTWLDCPTMLGMQKFGWRLGACKI